MKIRYEKYNLKLRHTFTIARESMDVNRVLFITLWDNGSFGTGEASPSERYKDSIDGIIEFIKNYEFKKPIFDNLNNFFEVSEFIKAEFEESPSLRAALETAILDLNCKKMKIPLYRYFGLNPHNTPQTSFTIGIAESEIIRKKVCEAEKYPILKIKMGFENDYRIIETIRQITDKLIRVDANEGWGREEALEKIQWLQAKNVEFVEQPIAAGNYDDVVWLRERVNIPIIADEDCREFSDLFRLSEVYDGINIKFMKCGGPLQAWKMIIAARSLGLKIMLGCMIESSVAISAAAHLTPAVNFADLDGNLLITNDPFTGVKVVNGRLVLPEGPGIGLKRKNL
ncbi:MAG: dipeptide epimerase [Fidelibacterota bacterium]